MQKTTIRMQDYRIDNGKLVKGEKTLIVFAASSRGTNCVLRDLADKGESVIGHSPVQCKVDKEATANAIKTLAGSQFKSEADREAFAAYAMSVLTSANLFKVEKVTKA